MLSDTAYLALLLDAPLQSWGFASRFQRRTTGLHPTKSGLIGMICAAMGLAKGSVEEGENLPMLTRLKMTSIAIPRKAAGDSAISVRRLEDYHTVLGTRRASGAMNKDAVVTHRQYLLDARFGVILSGDRLLLEQVAAALQDPVWGVWFGRKNCIPAAPIYRGELSDTYRGALQLLTDVPEEKLTRVSEVEQFEERTDSIADQPISFGDGKSSGPDKRQFAMRRIKVQPGVEWPAEE